MAAALGEPADPTVTAAGGVLVSRASRPLRRSLTPLEWVVLEDVALDATEAEDGALLAATSARQVAEHLGVSPGSAAKALARLRSLGFVTHDRQPGPAGRFGLSLYRLLPPAGVEVVAPADTPCTDAPRAESPCTASPCAASPRAAERHMAAGASADARAEGAARPTRSGRRPAPDPDHRQLDLLVPADAVDATADQSASQPHHASTPSPTTTLPTDSTPPSSTRASSTPTPTRSDTCQLFEQAAGRRGAERC